MAGHKTPRNQSGVCCSVTSPVDGSVRRHHYIDAGSRHRSSLGQELLCSAFMLTAFLLFFHNNLQALCVLGPQAATSGMSSGSSDSIATAGRVTGITTPGTSMSSSCGAASATSYESHTDDTSKSWSSVWCMACYNVHPDASQCSTILHATARWPWLSSRLQSWQTAAQQCTQHTTTNSSSSRLVGLAVRPVCAVQQAGAYLLQALTLIGGWGWLAQDLVILVALPLRLLLLALPLLPLPIINPAAAVGLLRTRRGGSSSSRSLLIWYQPQYYWQYPQLRYSLRVLQRLLPHAVASLCMVLGWYSQHYLSVSSLKHFEGYAMYLYQTWLAVMLPVPFKVQLLLCPLEWILAATTSSKARRLYSSTGSSGGSGLSFMHWCVSLLFVAVIPTAAAWCMGTMHAGEQHQHQHSNNSSCTSSKQRTKAKEEHATPVAKQSNEAEAGSSSSSQFQRDIAHSLQLAAAHNNNTSSSSSYTAKVLDIPLPVQAAAMAASSVSSSSSIERMRQLIPCLSAVLPDADVAAVFEAAAQQAQQLPAGRIGVMHYTSVAATMPISIKLHSAPHSSVNTLGPLLTSAISQQLQHHSSTSSGGTAGDLAADSAEQQIQAVCFPGCVQLIACVYALRGGLLPDPAAAAAAAAAEEATVAAAQLTQQPGDTSNSSSSKDSGVTDCNSRNGSSSSSNSLAADLLGAAQAAISGSQGRAAASGDVATAVDVHVGSAHAAVRPGGSTSSSSSSSKVGSESSEPTAAPTFQVVSCEPCCAVAASQRTEQQQQQHLTLLLRQHDSTDTTASSSSSSVGSTSSCRMLVFQHGSVVKDELMQLEQLAARGQQHWTARIMLPALATGLAHIALLPDSDQEQQQQQQEEEGVKGSQESVHTRTRCDPGACVKRFSSSSNPMLLLPILVLPAAAASELEASRQQLVAAAADSADTETGAMLAWQQISGLLVDIGYLLSVAAAQQATQTAAAASAGATTLGPSEVPAGTAAAVVVPYPPAVTSALRHVCVHLAAAGLHNTLEFLVQRMAVAAAAAAPASITVPTGDNSHTVTHQDAKASSSSGSSADSTCIKPAASAAASHESSSRPGASAPAPVPFSQLLCGFSDQSMERRYCALQYMSTSTLDMLTLLHNALLAATCWFGKSDMSATHSNQHQGDGRQGVSSLSIQLSPNAYPAGVAAGVWRYVWSFVVVWGLQVAMPAAILLLRRRVQQQQARRLVQPEAGSSSITITTSSSSSSSGGKLQPRSGEIAKVQSIVQPEQQEQQQTTAYYQAWQQRQLLMLCWMVSVILLNFACTTNLIVTPAMIVKAWSSPDFVHSVSMWLGVGLIKGWEYQVPWLWFVPLMTCEILSHVVASVNLTGIRGSRGLESLQLISWGWFVVRYGPALLLAAGTAAVRNVWSRQRFLASYGSAGNTA